LTRYLSLAEYFYLAERVTGLDPATLMKVANVTLADSALHAPAAGFDEEEFYPGLIDKAAVLGPTTSAGYSNRRGAVTPWRWLPSRPPSRSLGDSPHRSISLPGHGHSSSTLCCVSDRPSAPTTSWPGSPNRTAATATSVSPPRRYGWARATQLAELDPVLDGTAPAILGLRTVTAHALAAAARDARGETAAAETALERALDLAEPDGGLTPFAAGALRGPA
jgi:hypothetical protein